MKTIILAKEYNLQIIQTEETANKIYEDLTKNLQAEDVIQIDMANIVYITTNCMRKMLGQVYRDLGKNDLCFYEKIKTINVNRKISSIIDLVLEEERKC